MNIAVDLEKLQPVLREVGVADAVAVVPMAGGSAPVFRIDLADAGRLVLKTYPDGRPWTPGKDAYAAGLLRELDVPVTRYLMLDESRTRLPFRFAVTNYLHGETVESLKGEPDIAEVYRQMGALIRKLHTVRMPGYGRLGASGVIAPVETNAEFVRAIAAETFDRFRHFGGDEALARQLERIVDDRFDAIAPHSSGAVFAHDDVHPGNVLAARGADGRLAITGLIDFGNVRAADAVYDLAKCIFCSVHQAPDCRAPMLEGYGAIDHPDPEGALRLYTLLHRAMMWWWLRHIGEVAADEPHGLLDDLRAMADAAA